MFGYCIWYKILDIHIINLIKELSILLNTCTFNPHLTILYNLKEGDYIEIGQLGAYSLTFRTKFNGFYSDKIFEVRDKPIMSMYEKDSASNYLVA